MLGQRHELVTAEPLRGLTADTDPYLAAEAITALVHIISAETDHQLLVRLERAGAAPVRRAARAILTSAMPPRRGGSL